MNKASITSGELTGAMNFFLGLAFGVLIGFFATVRFWRWGEIIPVTSSLLLGLVCAFLARRYGKSFWRRLPLVLILALVAALVAYVAMLELEKQSFFS